MKKFCWIFKANLQSEIELLDARNEALEKILKYKHSAAEIAVQAADIRSIEDDMNVWFCCHKINLVKWICIHSSMYVYHLSLFLVELNIWILLNI